MGRNPDNPKKCQYLMDDGVHCFEKSAQHSYTDEVIEGKEDWLVKCPFIRGSVTKVNENDSV